MTGSVLRRFGLNGGRFDYQWVSHIDSKGQPIGYSKNKDNALRLSEWQLTRVTSYLRAIGANFTISNLEARNDSD